MTPWVHLKRPDQIRSYETIRDRRTKLPEIRYRKPTESSGWGSRGDEDENWQHYREPPTGLGEGYGADGAPWAGPANNMEGGGSRDAWYPHVMHDGDTFSGGGHNHSGTNWGSNDPGWDNAGGNWGSGGGD